MQTITVSDNGRFLVQEDGSPFFYLGDTAWEIFHRLNREEVDRYLADRAEKRFTVIQAVVLGEINGLSTPNAYGDLPLLDFDPARPNDRYFRHVDYVIERAGALGLYVGLLPTWGAYAVEEKHPLFEDHFLFNPATAHPYGRFLGERYRERTNILWILGGDRRAEGYEETWRAMARGIADGTGGDRAPVMTYHPWGGRSSAEWLHGEPWLTFNMVQSGHHRDGAPYAMIAADYARTPVKPVVNGEPGYEAIPDGLKVGQPRLGERDVRRFAYQSLFAGACGHTYGANEIWMMWTPEIEPISPRVPPPFLGATRPWHEALDYPGAGQMRYVRALIESRPFLTRVPDQDLIASDPGEGERRIQAARDEAGRYAFVYIPDGRTTEVDLSRLAGGAITAQWFDPRTGAWRDYAEVSARGVAAFTPPPDGPDWVLVLDATP